jgi:hypothetical protein
VKPHECSIASLSRNEPSTSHPADFAFFAAGFAAARSAISAPEDKDVAANTAFGCCRRHGQHCAANVITVIATVMVTAAATVTASAMSVTTTVAATTSEAKAANA